MVRDVWRRRFSECQSAMAKLSDGGVNDIENRLRGSKACRDREIAELPCPAPEKVERVVRVPQLVRPATEFSPDFLESLGVRALKAVNCLLQIADHEERAGAAHRSRSTR